MRNDWLRISSALLSMLFFSPLALAAVSRPVCAPVQNKGLFFFFFSKTSLAKQNIRRLTALLGNINIVAV